MAEIQKAGRKSAWLARQLLALSHRVTSTHIDGSKSLTTQ
jgi:hypothetical protein